MSDMGLRVYRLFTWAIFETAPTGLDVSYEHFKVTSTRHFATYDRCELEMCLLAYHYAKPSPAFKLANYCIVPITVWA